MKPFLKKEIRILLPGFLAGAAMTLANLFIRDASEFNGVPFFISFVVCPALVVFMALNSFGTEISAGTFSLLLAQPTSRRRIWWTKSALLAAALGLCGFLWCAIFYLHVEPLKHAPDFGDWRDLFLGVWLFLLAVYSGSLWTVLLLRQVAAAFWFTLLIPCAIIVSVIGLLGEEHADWSERAIVSALLIYILAGFLFARRLFLRAQDVQWSGGTIALPEFQGSLNFLSRAAKKRFWRPQAALFGKELQLHQSQFIMAGMLALLHLGVIAEYKFGHIDKNSTLEFVLQRFWGLWLVMPLLVGAAAVSEERKLGTLGGQLCLPVKARQQFWVKFRVVLILSILFGVIMPVLLEGARILPNISFPPAQVFPGYPQGTLLEIYNSLAISSPAWLPELIFIVLATGIGTISLYASSLSRNTLQALAPAILGLLVFFTLLLTASQPVLFFHYSFWRGGLIYLIGLPIFVTALLLISFLNFQRSSIGWHVWWRNLLGFTVTLAVAVVATAAIYHRAWEKITPFEPAHDEPRLSLSNPATIDSMENNISIRLPDGRIWTGDYMLNSGRPDSVLRLLSDIRLTSLDDGHFYNGSNWTSIVHTIWLQTIGLKTDGTLWITEKPKRPKWRPNDPWKMPQAGNFKQFGDGTNWSSLVSRGSGLLLVKKDGTLWQWGARRIDQKNNEATDLQSFTPHQLGTESNWTEVFLDESGFYLRKTDGSSWVEWNGNQKEQLEVERGFKLGRTIARPRQWRKLATIWNFNKKELGIGDDGSLRLLAYEKLNPGSRSFEWMEANLQLGRETNWLSLAACGRKLVTLKSDGSLWQWNFQWDFGPVPDLSLVDQILRSQTTVRLGIHSDWIAIASMDGGIVSLAADGSLWFWPLEDANYLHTSNGTRYYNQDQLAWTSLLEASRKPQFLGNVFAASN